ncbi:MAG TPA: nucleotidyltransferase domain-containing protein [Patescibacteria group bacterium]|nr:nucleotidyltransferase domain-containing protein [Patescibacteria group bacterium]
MALPVQSIRAQPEHRQVLQAVADLLRQGKEAELRLLLADIGARSVGPFRDEAAAIAFLRDRLVVALRPRMVWLFGSRARQDARIDSDFDLLVVLPDGLAEGAYSHHAVAAPVVACGLPFDVVPCTWTDFLRDRDLTGSLVNRATAEGRLLYQDRALRRQMAA